MDSGGPSQPPGRFPEPPAIPHHTLLRRIGSGGYGDVWLARNSMGTFRAVKIVYRSSFDEDRPFERELSGIRKFEPVSRSHEGFIDVLHVALGESADYFFYIMEIGDACDGGSEINPDTYVPKTLSRVIASRGRMKARDCMELGSALARALHRLHQHGLVHRDVKPSNIIFVDGIPKLADIGLVAGVDETRSYVGTEGFIPPEGPGTPQADVFSLGRVLYQASTGGRPADFPGLPEGYLSFEDLVLFLELNEVCLRACKDDPARRYTSAAEMQADLMVLLDGKSVRRLRVLERRLGAAKRGVIALGTFLLLAAIISYPFYRDHREKGEARQREIGSATAYGNQLLEAGDLLGSLHYFADAFRLHHETHTDEAADRRRMGTILAQCPKLTHYWHEASAVVDGEFSPDGQRVLITVGGEGCLVYDLRDDTTRSVIQSRSALSARFSLDGSQIAVASSDHTATIFDASTFSRLVSFSHPGFVSSACFSPDGRRLVTACGDGVARVWNIETHAVEHQLSHSGPVRFAQFSHDGRMIGTASQDHTACLWDAQSGQKLRTLPHPSWVYAISFSPDDSQVATGCADHNARVWHTNGAPRLPLLPHDDLALAAEFAPDGRWLLTASLDGTTKFWDAATLLPVKLNPVLRNGEKVQHASFSGDGRQVVLTGSKGAVAVWDFSGQQAPPQNVRCIPSDDGKRLMFVNPSGLLIQDADTGKPVGPPIKIEGSFQRVKINYDGTLASVVQSQGSRPGHRLVFFDASRGSPIGASVDLVTDRWAICLGDDGTHAVAIDSNILHFITVKSGLDETHRLPTEGIDSVRLDPASQRLVTWSVASKIVEVWKMPGAELSFPTIKMDGLVSDVRISPDGARLLACCWDTTLNPLYGGIWSMATGRSVGPRLMHGDGVLAGCFSPDGSQVATGSEDFTARIWNGHDELKRVQTVRHHDHVQVVAFDPTGRELLTGSLDNTARIWNAMTGDPLSPPLRRNSNIRNAAYVGNGDRVFLETADGGNYVWDVTPVRMPLEDLRTLVDVLCGVSTDLLKDGGVGDAARACENWRQLKAKYPTRFSATESEIARWHEETARDSELANDWRSAAFHLRYLAQTGDTNVVSRLDKAEANLRQSR